MARPRGITDDEVLAAARAVFLERGITATVEEVAARCGVGEATVFRRFPTKQALFIAAMDSQGELEWEQTLRDHWPTPSRAELPDIRITLTVLANEQIVSGRRMMPFLLMKLSNPAFFSRARPPARVLRILRVLTEFFAAQIAAGRVRGRDPRVAARIWLGSLQNRVMFETIGEPSDDLTSDAFIEGLVDLFCEQVEPARRVRKN